MRRLMISAMFIVVSLGLASFGGATAAGGTPVVFSSSTPAGVDNSENAKLCQHDGWTTLVRQDGTLFTNTGGCVSYAARGGALASFTGCFIINTDTGSFYNASATALHDAVLAASPGDALIVRGTCIGGVTIDKDLRIIGLASPGYRGPTLDGNNAASVLHVTCGIACGAHVAITALTITNGKGDPAGGILSESSNLTLTDSTISGNTGRGVFGFKGSVTLNHCMVSGNGGGVATHFGLLAITDSTITGNTGAFAGGGVSVSFSFATTITNSTVSGNAATNGGGVSNTDIFSSVSIINSTVSGNTATADGGGIYNGGPAAGATGVALTNSTVSDNTAARGGGIANSTHGAGVGIIHGTVTRNTATDPNGGGGIFNDLGHVTLTGSSVTLNYSPSFPTINNCVGTIC